MNTCCDCFKKLNPAIFHCRYDFKGIIDYIFYTKDHFNLLGNLEMISEDWLKKEKVPGCPHPHIASDHFPLLVELELKPPGSERGHSSSHSLRK